MSDRDLEILAWIIVELYDGGSWSRMEQERPEINEVMERLNVWTLGATR